MKYEVNISPASTVLYLEDDGGEVRLCGTFLIKVAFNSLRFVPSDDKSLDIASDPAMRLDVGHARDNMDSREEFDRTHYPPCPDLDAAFHLKAEEEPHLKKLPGKTTTHVVLAATQAAGKSKDGTDAAATKWPQRTEEIGLSRYQMTAKYEFKMPLIIDASRLPFDRYEIRMQFGFSPTLMRSPKPDKETRDAPVLFEFDIPDLKLEPKGAKEKFYPKPSLIEPAYRTRYAKDTPKDLMPEYDVERGSTDLQVLDHDYKRPLAYCFVLQRVEIKGILSVLLPLYSLILFSPLCQVFNNESLNDSATYLATLMLALIAHRAVIDERTRLAAGLSKYDWFFFLAMFMIVIQFIVLIIVREVQVALEDGNDGDGSSDSSSLIHDGFGGAGGASRMERRRSSSGVNPIQWQVFSAEMLLIVALVLVDLTALMMQMLSARLSKNKTDVFQVNKPYLVADFVMEVRDIEGERVEVLLSDVFHAHLKEWKRIRNEKDTQKQDRKGLYVAINGKERKLDVQLKSFLSLLIKALDSQKGPRDILRARLHPPDWGERLPKTVKRPANKGDDKTASVLDASPQELKELFSHWTIPMYSLEIVTVKEVHDFTSPAPANLQKDEPYLFILRYKHQKVKDVWLELQLLDKKLPAEQHLAYKVSTYADTMRELSLPDRVMSVGFGVRLRLFERVLTFQGAYAELYAFANYRRAKVDQIAKSKRDLILQPTRRQSGEGADMDPRLGRPAQSPTKKSPVRVKAELDQNPKTQLLPGTVPRSDAPLAPLEA